MVDGPRVPISSKSVPTAGVDYLYGIKGSNAVVKVHSPIFNIKDYGATGDGTTNDRTAFQTCLTAANAVGGGVVYIPLGRFRLAGNASEMLIMYSNTTIRGAGDGSVIFFDDRDTVARSGNDMLSCSNTSNIAFEHFKIEGTALTYTNETNQKQCLTGSVIDGLRMIGVTIEKTRYMATAFSYVKNAVVIGNRLDYIVRDGIRFTNSDNVIVTANNLRRVGDDAIALHSLDAATTPSAGFVVTGNTLEACQGVKVLGAKILSIRDNIFRRTLRSPIVVEMPNTGTEGNTPQFYVDVCDNIITDTFGSRGANYNILVGTKAGRSDGGTGTDYGVTARPLDYNYINDINTGTVVNVGMKGVRVSGNVIARTLKNVANYSLWGYGQLFDRTTTNFLSDPAITDTDFQEHGILLYGPIDGLSVSQNKISGLGTGYDAIEINISGTANLIDYSDAVISENELIDCPGVGINCSAAGSGNGAKQIIIRNNVFDLDPYFRAATHNADNTWSATGGVVGIYTANVQGLIAGGNIFKNCGRTGIETAEVIEVSANIAYGDFAGSGDNASNKGVRQLPSAAANLIVPIDGDPTSGTYGQISNNVLTISSTMPTSGKYCAGHRVIASSPAVAGAGGSQYMITGWWRVSTGTGHVLDTDWRELRTLTGT
jgi:hypothetical protein